MKNVSNTKNNKKKKYNSSNKGFTLVELLAVIALLAIISVIGVFAAVNVIGTAKEKSYRASINNIEKQAGTYALENQASLIWLDVENDLTKQFFCVSVQDLIDTGYFNNDVLDSYIDDDVTVQSTDNIYLERDKTTKTVEKNILLSSVDGYDGLCGNISANGNINFLVQPIGWAKEKNITITYKLLNNSDNIDNYEYSYVFEEDDGEVHISKNDNFDKNTVIENVTITENGTLNALIDVNDGVSKTLEITTIDNTGPEIEIEVVNGNVYSKSKEATIRLIDNESGFKAGNYQVYYKWSMTNMSCSQLKNSGEIASLVVEDNNSNRSNSVSVTIDGDTGVGKLYVCGDNISDYVGNEMGNNVTTADIWLDNIKPVVALGTYNGESEVTGSVTIPLVVTDNHSGVDSSTFTSSDIKVSIGDIELSNGIALNKVTDNNYNLEITNSINYGEVTITIINDGVYDNAGNGNIETTLNTGIKFKNIYKISYNSNGGTGSMLDTECIYGENCTLRTNTFTRTGYKFLGWSESSSATSSTYNNDYVFSPYDKTNNITLYAVWKVNRVNIRYNVNGGIVTENTSGGTYTTDASGLLYVNNNILFDTVNYDGSTTENGIANYNNTSYLNITKTGYNAVNGAEWKCLSGCSDLDKTYSQNSIYNDEDFCDASNGDCTVTLGVNWIPKIVNVMFQRNYDSSDTTMYFQSFTYDDTGNRFGYNNDGTLKWGDSGQFGSWDREGYTLLGWSTSQDATTANYDVYGNVSGDWINNYSPSITLYAVWKVNKVYINYNVNGGVVTANTQAGTHTTDASGLISRNGNVLFDTVNYGGSTTEGGVGNYNNASYLNITRTGYNAVDGAEWKCLSGCSDLNKTYSQNAIYNDEDFCDASNGNCTVVLGVNWQINTYTISYNANGGSGAPASQTKTYDVALTLSTEKPTRTGYTFLGWAESSAATSKQYDAGGSYTKNETKTLYAVWKSNTSGGTCNDLTSWECCSQRCMTNFGSKLPGAFVSGGRCYCCPKGSTGPTLDTSCSVIYG